MKITKHFKKKSNIEEEIDNICLKLSTLDKDSEEYLKVATNLERICKANSYDTTSRISSDTALLVAGNLLGILFILGYEKANIITTKALGFVLKGRV